MNWFEEIKQKVRDDLNQNRPRCPECNGSLVLWGDANEMVHAHCSECEWTWIG